ncbi:MAG: chemotaxis response regulator protein-glutamate methylesterase [Planctomycetota bacterium]|jgi:two-component system chemotaxis response regulator CheB|nr:chemotaxis response regulator protein-glutamate methylesterase [Planctomycetota bacterium]
MSKPIRVIIVDDSALVRDILSAGLSADPALEVVGTAADPFEAGEKIPVLKPDVMTLDVEMPRMNGLEFLRRLMPQYPLPVVMVSALTEKGKQLTMDALSLGAVDFVAKPKANLTNGMEDLLSELIVKIKIASNAKLLRFKTSPSGVTQVVNKQDVIDRVAAANSVEPATRLSNKVIIIGASTGGTEAVREVVTRFPAQTPGVLVVQHMPGGFTRLFANRLGSETAMKAKEAEDGDTILQGRILVAPGGKQMRVRENAGGGFAVNIVEEPSENGHAPSVNTTMSSVAKVVGNSAIGVILTGMGADGADSMKELRGTGARCFAQDEATSVVFGMPNEAYKRGGAERLVPISEMAKVILDCLAGK